MPVITNMIKISNEVKNLGKDGILMDLLYWSQCDNIVEVRQ
jgi:hypothetical protein